MPTEGWTTMNAEFTPEMMEHIEGFAAYMNVSKQEALRCLVGLALHDAGAELF